mmetsp:Transcript_13401/g.31719  ORF Transcript_13401/g.31719 Transcript_13401/m.31719 type:complete len:233 (+) Transcript_13401:450-1148(+)
MRASREMASSVSWRCANASVVSSSAVEDRSLDDMAVVGRRAGAVAGRFGRRGCMSPRPSAALAAATRGGCLSGAVDGRWSDSKATPDRDTGDATSGVRGAAGEEGRASTWREVRVDRGTRSSTKDLASNGAMSTTHSSSACSACSGLGSNNATLDSPCRAGATWTTKSSDTCLVPCVASSHCTARRLRDTTKPAIMTTRPKKPATTREMITGWDANRLVPLAVSAAGCWLPD